MKRVLLFFFMLVLHIQGFSQAIIRGTVRPSKTDTSITEYDLLHHFLRTEQDTMNSLVVFLPGTYRQPSHYSFTMEQLALLGYHVIGLMYKTDPPINPECRPTDDVTCHWRARMETIDGTDRHPAVFVNYTNSIVNRLQKVLQYLIINRPGQGWDQFYSSNQIQWNKIIVTGHSQGASLSGIMGKEYPVKRVVMFSVMDYLDNGKIPSWVDNTANSEKYYAFIHPKDEVVPFTVAQIGWEKLGMTQYGAMCNADCNQYPFNNSHILYTQYTPSKPGIDVYHNGIMVDTYMTDETAYKNSLREVIKYFFRK